MSHPPSPRSPRQTLGVILFVTLALSAVYSLVRVLITPEGAAHGGYANTRSDYLLMLLQCVLGLAVFALPSLLEHKWRLEIPNFIYVMYYVFLYCAIFLGEVMDFRGVASGEARILSVIEEAAKRGKKFLFTLTTNGLLLKDDVAKFLNEEMENVVLSLDGRKEVHDAVRKTANGKGSFDYVIQNLKDFVAIRGNKSYYVRGTFTAKNLDFAKDVLFIADSGFDSISMEPVVTELEDLAITAKDLPAVKEQYDVLCDAYLKRYAEGKGFNFFHFNVDLEGGPCLAKRVSACGAGNEYFSVTPNGDIYPCHQFAGDTDFLMGNVYEGKLDGAIRAKFKNSCLFTRKKCDSCFAKFICSGGCSANNYHFNGDIDEPYEITCEMMRKRTEDAMHILACKKKLREGEEGRE